MRALYRHYYQNTDGIIFVVDSNDAERFEAAKDELHRMLPEDELQGIPLLVYCNKQDLAKARSISEICDKMGLNSIRNRAWYLQSCCATTGEGLYPGLEWLESELTRKGTRAEAAPTSTFKVAPNKQRGKGGNTSSKASADNSQSRVSKFLSFIF